MKFLSLVGMESCYRIELLEIIRKFAGSFAYKGADLTPVSPPFASLIQSLSLADSQSWKSFTKFSANEGFLYGTTVYSHLGLLVIKLTQIFQL